MAFWNGVGGLNVANYGGQGGRDGSTPIARDTLGGCWPRLRDFRGRGLRHHFGDTQSRFGAAGSLKFLYGVERSLRREYLHQHSALRRWARFIFCLPFQTHVELFPLDEL